MKTHNSRSLKDYIKTVLINIGIKILDMKLKTKKKILTYIIKPDVIQQNIYDQ